MQAGIAAGEHYDPEANKTHKGPHGPGHKGDLPLLTADTKGISQIVTAPRLKLAEIRGRAFVSTRPATPTAINPKAAAAKDALPAV